MRRVFLLGIFMAGCAACSPPNGGVTEAAAPTLAEDDETFVAFAAGASAEDLLPAIDAGLRTRGKAAKPGLEYEVGLDTVWFVIIRDGDRHGTDFRPQGFHAVVGAGVRYPAGALLIRRDWSASGQVDGTNEQPQTWGISVVVEPGAERPYPSVVSAAATAFVAALVERKPIHPDCVLAMEEIPYTNAHEVDVDERGLAAAVRANLPPPPAPGRMTIHTADGPRSVSYERRHTSAGISVGMMMRRRFDGPNRGMLFEYPYRYSRNFYMRNCPIPMDLAYLRDGKIEQLHRMEPGFGIPQKDLPWYSSNTPVRFALELPVGWFGRNGVKVGDKVEFE